MNKRDRARLYRLQNKRHAQELTTAVASLRDQVHRLQLDTEVTHCLALCSVPQRVRERILSQLQPFIANPSRHIVMPAFDVQTTQLQRADGYGSGQGPIVQITSVLTGQHPATALEDIYRFIPGNSVLMDTLMHGVVVYPCVLRFFFSTKGELTTTDVEIDWISGLSGCMGSLLDVAKVAEPLCELGDPYVVWNGSEIHQTSA